MVDMVLLIEEIEKNVADFNIKAAMEKVAALTEKIILASNSLEQSKLEKMMDTMGLMNSALSNKDYLLLSDVLEYELKPFINMNIK
ncbi:MAG: hypothetical protein JJE17_08500 [Peptostreptococcaceae bacterium]|nr:hypothetical protein [Peptostreptococcaceae bacterium]